MTGQLVKLEHYVGECENSAELYVGKHPKTPLSFALTQVVALIALYENEYGFTDDSSVKFDDFVSAFGQYKNGIEDRGEFALCIESSTTLTQEQDDAMNIALPLLPSITVVDAQQSLAQLFNYIEKALAAEFNVDSFEILETNPPLSKAILIMRDLIREGHVHWGDEVEDLFLAQF